MKLSKAQESKIKKAILQHSEYCSSEDLRYTTNWDELERDWFKEENTWAVKFKLNGNMYEYRSIMSGRKRLYYRGEFYLNGQKRDCRLFKGLLKD